ncbi:MAG: hypothetical protein F4059_05440 [Gemmatimonadetes bacterium]|nr:hypothetical protein [Gemmatimonadota bacterium]
MAIPPVAPALLAPLLGLALGVLPLPGAPLHAQSRMVPGQVARFLDGDSVFVAVAVDLDAARFAVVRTGLLAFSGPNDPVFARTFRNEVLQPVIAERCAVTPRLVAVQADSERGYRGRIFGQEVTPLARNGLVVSDPLLLDPGLAALPETRQEALDGMLPRLRIGSESEMAAYWEVYGLEAGTMMEISVSLERQRAGVLTRIFRSMRGRQVPPAPVVSWTEPASGPVHGMALAVGVAELTNGNYDLKIAVAGPDGSVATAIRRFRVRGR